MRLGNMHLQRWLGKRVPVVDFISMLRLQLQQNTEELFRYRDAKNGLILESIRTEFDQTALDEVWLQSKICSTRHPQTQHVSAARMLLHQI